MSKKQPDRAGIHLLSGCWHVPFENKLMLNGVLNLINDLKPKFKGIHFLGDTLDISSLSAHDRGQMPIRGLTLGREYSAGNEFLDKFDKVTKGLQIEKTYMYGNHEDRYNRAVKNVDVNKFADAIISPEQALKLKERGYKVYTNWKEDYHMLGKLQLIHGEFCSKSPARTHMDKLKGSVAFVHTHRIDIVYDGERAGFNIGWGGNKNAPVFGYVSRITKLNWINGFALVHIDKNGNYYTQVIPVYHNRFYYNGKLY